MRPKLPRKVCRSQSLWALSLIFPFLPIPYPFCYLLRRLGAIAPILPLYTISLGPLHHKFLPVRPSSILGHDCLLPNKHTI